MWDATAVFELLKKHGQVSQACHLQHHTCFTKTHVGVDLSKTLTLQYYSL